MLTVLMVTSCSRAVQIPREQIDDPAYREPGSYRIRMNGREEYLVRRFAVTDSTVVIREFLPSDQRYRFERSDIPRTIALADVKTISRMEFNAGLTYGVIIASAIVVTLLVIIATSEWSDEPIY